MRYGEKLKGCLKLSKQSVRDVEAPYRQKIEQVPGNKSPGGHRGERCSVKSRKENKRKPAQSASTGKTSDSFNEQLFRIGLSKLPPLVRMDSSFFPTNAAIDSYVESLRTRLQGIDRLCRKVWEIDGGALTPEFIHNTLRPRVIAQIDAAEGESVARAAATDVERWGPTWAYLAEQVGNLRSEFADRYELEIEELAPAKAEAAVSEVRRTESPPTTPKSWQEIEIAFLSDERVEICFGTTRQTHNYSELGFEDRRNEKPNRAWVMLREIARQNGTMPRPSPGTHRAMVQKRIEEIREKLRGHFKIQTDPIPFNGTTYEVSLKLSCRRSFDT
jgi:hypothetical protein